MPSPPPVTPAPSSRFLPPKRQAKLPPEQHPSSSTQQFAATPRFAASTPRAPATPAHHLPVFATPARAGVARGQFVSEAIESSPAGSLRQEDLSDEEEESGQLSRDSIEVESASSSSQIESRRRSSGDGDGVERARKRRRVSSSLELEISSLPDDGEDEDGDLPVLAEDASLPDDGLHALSSGSFGEDSDGSDVPMVVDQTVGAQIQTQMQARGHPAFQQPPRFKPSDVADTGQQCQLPEAFSPQRRGLKYVPGGLAAELRDWLVQIKGDGQNESESHTSGLNARLVVSNVRKGAGMALVKGHPVRDGVLMTQSPQLQMILAGDGRLTGLARNRVAKGSTVTVAQPTWEVVLHDKSRWVVACDWATQ